MAGMHGEFWVTGQSLCCCRPSFVMTGRGSLVLCTQRPAALAALAAPPPAHAHVYIAQLNLFLLPDTTSLLLSSGVDKDLE